MSYSRRWSDEEKRRLGELLAAGRSPEEIAAELGRSVMAVTVKRQRLYPPERPADGESYGWGRGKFGQGPYWTRERTIEGLRDFARRNPGRLPSSDHVYNRLKKGHMEWPPAAWALEYFGSMANAWEAAGLPKGRIARGWEPWTQADDDFLLEHAGEMTLKQIAARLRRSWGACKRRLYDLGAGRARDVSGHLSAMQVAKEYNCPLSRVRRLIASGELPAKRVSGGNYWRIDPADCERVRAKLAAPKHSYQGRPADVGDWAQRNGVRRKVLPDGRVVRVRAGEKVDRDTLALRAAVEEHGARRVFEALGLRGLVDDLGAAS
jgi:hypothetical protein